jgi:peptidoglycan/xylan/chitin deacetylase (PgdA/CDA1 family)
MLEKIVFIAAYLVLLVACNADEKLAGQTEITKWQYGKNAAVSLTYDDGSTNQFSQALPIMNRLGLPPPFLLLPGRYQARNTRAGLLAARFKEIIRETATAAD